MTDRRIEGLRGRVVRQSQDVATAETGEPASPDDEQEAQGAHAPDQVRIGAFAGAGFGRGQGIELEAPNEVVGEDTELLPSTVSAVVARGNDVQSELALELGDRLLLRAAAADEGVEGRQVQRQIRGDGAVLEMAIVGGEEIELEVLGALVGHVLAVDHHPQGEVPLWDGQVVEEAGDVRGHGEPALALGGELLQGQPVPVPDLDGIGTAPGGQQTKHGALAEGGVHAELQRQAAAERGPQAVDHFPQEGDALLGIVHVAGPVLYPQDVPRLGDVGQQRVVAGILAVMGIEAAEGPAHGGARAHDRAIEVDRQARQGQAPDRVDDEVVVELDQWAQGALAELPEPVADGAGGRDAGQPAEARDQGIAGDIAQVFEAAGADVEQREPAAPVVPAGGGARRAQSARQVMPPQVAAQQLQAAVRGQLLGPELDVQRALDRPSQARYAQTHQRGLLCVGSNVGAFSLSIAQGAFLLPIHDATQYLFSDWG